MTLYAFVCQVYLHASANRDVLAEIEASGIGFPSYRRFLCVSYINLHTHALYCRSDLRIATC